MLSSVEYLDINARHHCSQEYKNFLGLHYNEFVFFEVS